MRLPMCSRSFVDPGVRRCRMTRSGTSCPGSRPGQSVTSKLHPSPARKRTVLYIDSFIPPDRLADAHLRDNTARVRGAAACAIKAGAKIVSLGGFSSILIEGNFNQLPRAQEYGLHHRQYLDRWLSSSRASGRCVRSKAGTWADPRCSSWEQPETLALAAPAVWRMA